jgi:hypothetical protein
MGKGTRLHSISSHLVLIAVAIQGITPDVHDLASFRALHLLCPFLDSSDCWEDEDDLPDESSGPVRPGLRWVMGRLLDPTADSRFVSAETKVQLITLDALRLAGPCGTFVRTNGLIFWLCRLAC